MTKTSEDDAINRYLRLLHRERARAERARQAYVALTRAKRSLHLFVHPRVKEAAGRDSNSAPTRIRCSTTSGPPSVETPRLSRLSATYSAEEIAPAVTQTRKRRAAQNCGHSTSRRCVGARRAAADCGRAGRNRIQLGAPDCTTSWHRGSRSRSNDSEMPNFPRRVTCRACAHAWNRGCWRSASNPSVREPAPIAR